MAEVAGYAELVGRLAAAQRHGVVLGLDRIEALLAALGHPERRLGLVVQIAGTNGKGSTAAMVAAILSAAGLRTGLYTSPHLCRFTERMQVDGREIGAAELVAADRALGQPSTSAPASFFERVTAMALWWFAAERTDVAVLEVGLGGRFDATTAAGATVAAVTGVALDHEAYLGSTLAAIAGEKAGIFRAGQRAVIGLAGEPEAVPLLAAAARAASVAELCVLEPAAVAAIGPVGLAGAHQRRNAACALAIVAACERSLGRTLPAAARADGLRAARVPGRLERIDRPGRPAILLDGAHNPQAARILAEALAELAPRYVLVLGTSHDKDAAAILRPLVAGARAIVAVAARSERARPAVEIAAAARVGFAGAGAGAVEVAVAVAVADDVADGLRRAEALAGPDPIVVTGSLFVVGEARAGLLGLPLDAHLLDPVGREREVARPGPAR